MKPITINVHVHLPEWCLQTVAHSLASIHTKLDKQGVLLMAVSPQIAQFSARFDAATNKIAADLEALRLKLAAGTPLSPEDLAILDTSVTRLEIMGRDPENPVPEVPPVV